MFDLSPYKFGIAVKSCIAVMPAFAARLTAMWIPPFSIVCAPRSFAIPRAGAGSVLMASIYREGFFLEDEHIQKQTGTGSPEPAPALVGAEVLSEHQSDRDWNEGRIRVVRDTVRAVEVHVLPRF